MSARPSTPARAFTLIEAAIVIVALALIVPPAVSWMKRAGEDRVDAVNATRASFLASAVLEQVLADAASPASGLGMSALANPSAYLTTAGTGLYPRTAGLASTYTAIGFTYAVTIGPLVDQSGAVNANASLNVFRVVTVTVTFPASSQAAAHSLSIASMVGDL